MAIDTKSIINQKPTIAQETYFALSKIELLEKDHARATALLGSIRRLAKHTGRLSNYLYEAELNQLVEEKLPIDLEKKYFMELANGETKSKDLRKSYIAYMKAKMDFVRKVMKLYARLNRDYISFQKSMKGPQKMRNPIKKTKSVKLSEKKVTQATLLNWK